MFQAKGNNAFDYGVQILQHKGCRNAQDGNATRMQKGIAARIAVRAFTPIMGQAVNLDCRPPLQTDEIKDHFAQWVLAAELKATRSFAQFAPDQHFGQVAGAAFAFGDPECAVRGIQHPSTTRLCRAVPLPVPGRFFKRLIRHHILNTPKAGRSGIGASSVAAKASPSTSRVWAGSITPSSHSRAVA